APGALGERGRGGLGIGRVERTHVAPHQILDRRTIGGTRIVGHGGRGYEARAERGQHASDSDSAHEGLPGRSRSRSLGRGGRASAPIVSAGYGDPKRQSQPFRLKYHSMPPTTVSMTTQTNG